MMVLLALVLDLANDKLRKGSTVFLFFLFWGEVSTDLNSKLLMIQFWIGGLFV